MFKNNKLLHYVLFLLIIVTLIFSGLAFYNTNELKKSVTTLQSDIFELKRLVSPNTININDFLKKLTVHDPLKSYVGVSPLNVIQINTNNLANLQTQIAGLDESYIGNFIVQYSDRIAVYDYNNDQLKATVTLQQQQPQLSADFFTKLNKHPELQGLENEQPIGGQFDSNSLATLKQQFPDVYANAKVGDFLLRYQSRLIIYDYNNDKIVTALKLG